MNRLAPQATSLIIIICVLTVGGMTHVQFVQHAQLHDKHHTNTHSSVFCTWMCTAGVGIESTRILVTLEYGPVSPILTPHFRNSSIELLDVPSARAPPVHFVIS